MNKINFKKINSLLFSLIIVFSFLSITTLVLAQSTAEPTGNYNDIPYEPLAPLPGLEGPLSFSKVCPLGQYLTIFIDLFIGIVAVLSMIMIVMGGINYVMSDLVSSKEAAKSNIQNALLGLVIALSCYVILNTINPNLLKLCLDEIPNKTIEIDPGIEGSGHFTPISKDTLKDLGVKCPGSGGTGAIAEIAKSFEGKVVYNQSARGTTRNNRIYLDCSSFVSQVYACAGISSPGSTTAGIFNFSNATGSFKDSPNLYRDLTVGSLLGWKKGQSSKYPDSGHVVMYIGNGQFIEVNSTNGVQIRNLSSYQGQYYHKTILK